MINYGKTLTETLKEEFVPYFRLDKPVGRGFGTMGERAVKRSLRCATVNGISLHCNVAVAADKRQHLEQLLRYMARSSLSLQRLSLDDHGQVIYQLKKPFGGPRLGGTPPTARTGKTPLVLSPLEFIEKVAALIPPSRMHMTRFHGIFAPNAAWRKLIVVEGLGKLIEEKLGALAVGPVGPSLGLMVAKPARPKRELTAGEKYTWATMLRRIYKIDLTICPDCQGRLRLRRKVLDPVEAKKIIEGMGLSIRPPPTKPSRVVTLDLD